MCVCVRACTLHHLFSVIMSTLVHTHIMWNQSLLCSVSWCVRVSITISSGCVVWCKCSVVRVVCPPSMVTVTFLLFLLVIWSLGEYNSQVKRVLSGGRAQGGERGYRPLPGDPHSLTAKTLRHLHQKIGIQHIFVFHNLSCMY